MKTINEPHKPHCAYLCLGDGERRPCDCGAVTEPRLEISLGARSVELIHKALGRLDSDEANEAGRLGLTSELAEFMEAYDKTLGDKLRRLLASSNHQPSVSDKPFPFASLAPVIAKALAHRTKPEPRETPDERPLGIGYLGLWDGPEPGRAYASLAGTPRLHHVFVLAIVDGSGPDAPVTVGIAMNRQYWGDPPSFWPELTPKSSLWADQRKLYVKWMHEKADDRVQTTRLEAQGFVDAFKSVKTAH